MSLVKFAFLQSPSATSGSAASNSVQLHRFFALDDRDFVTVLLEDVDAILSVLVALGLGVHLLVVGLEVALVVDLAALDDAHIDVGARTQVVVHTCLDRLHDQGLRLLLRHVLTVLGLHDGHGRKGSRAHRQERSSLGVPVRRNLDELGAAAVDSTNDAVGADLAAVVEDVLGEAAGGHLNAVLSVGVEAVQLELALNHLCGKSVFWLRQVAWGGAHLPVTWSQSAAVPAPAQ
mgnify:CR=1 FL=1